jgi:glycosyltransferase involved in cell wall biosynthesis
MKKLLLLAFYFPPRNHIASYRSGCFAKFLPENGWLPTVVCDDWPAERPNYDPDFVGIIPEEVKIHRILAAKPAGFYERFVLRKIAPYVWPHRAPIRWWQQARAKVHFLLRSQRFDAIWATSDPMVPMGLAAEAAEMAGIPWVADIRDSFNVQRMGSWYKRPFFARQERRLTAMAGQVVAVSAGLAEGLGGRIGRRVEVIPNGFDLSLLPDSPPARAPLFTILYAGALMLPHRNPAPLLRAVELCIERKFIPADQIEVLFYGSDAGLIDQTFPGALQRVPMKVLPRISHREILRAQMSSAVLLLLTHASEKGVLTGKVFDYLAAGRPILAVPDDHGEIASLLRRTGAGLALTATEDIVDLLAKWHGDWKAGRDTAATRNAEEIGRYSRRAQAKRLAEILDGMAAGAISGRSS